MLDDDLARTGGCVVASELINGGVVAVDDSEKEEGEGSVFSAVGVCIDEGGEFLDGLIPSGVAFWFASSSS